MPGSTGAKAELIALIDKEKEMNEAIGESGEELRNVANLAQTTVIEVLMKGRGNTRSLDDDRCLEHHVTKALNHLDRVDAPIAPSYKPENIERLKGALTRIAIVLYLVDAHSNSDRGGKE